MYRNLLIDGEWGEHDLVRITADDVVLRHCTIRHGSDHDRVDMMPRQNGEDILCRSQKFVWIGHGRVVPCVGLSQA